MRNDLLLDGDLLHFLVALDGMRKPNHPPSLASLVAYSGGSLSREEAENIQKAAVRDSVVRERLFQVHRTVSRLASGALKPGQMSPAENPFGAEIVFEWQARTAGSFISAAVSEAPLHVVGRDREIREIKAIFEEPASRLVTLAGDGGVGKTYLLRKLAEDLQGGEGIFLECGSVVHAGDLYAMLASRLGLEQAEDAGAAIREHLASRQTLLLLDRWDHLRHLRSDLRSLVNSCPSLRVVATSRTPLDLDDERVYPLQPLAEDAVTLFVDLAKRIVQDFKTTAANLKLAGEACQFLMGVPLSIAIAAGCLQGQTLPDLIEGLRVPPGGPEIPADRFAQTSLARSFLLLSASDRMLLHRLTAFNSQFAFEDARYVCGLADLPLSDSLAHLQRCGLLTYSHGIRSAIYRLHDAVEEHFRALPPSEAARAGLADANTRHTEAFAEKAEEIGRLMSDGRWGQGIQNLLEQNPNLRRAIARSERNKDFLSIRRFADSLSRTYFEAGFLQDFGNLAGSAVQASEALSDDSLRMRTLSLQGALAARSSDNETCARLWLEKLALCRKLNDVANAADTLNDLAWEAHEQGDDTAAEAYLEEGRKLAEDAKSKELIGSNFVIRARFALAKGEEEVARQWIARTKEAITGADNQDLLLFVEQNIILTYVGLEENDEVADMALKFLRKSFEGRRVIHIGWALRQLGSVYQEKGDVARAAKCYTAARSAYNEYRTKHVKRVEVAMESLRSAYGPGATRELATAEGIPWGSIVEELLHAE